jgi:hypothetical protein
VTSVGARLVVQRVEEQDRAEEKREERGNREGDQHRRPIALPPLSYGLDGGAEAQKSKGHAKDGHESMLASGRIRFGAPRVSKCI